MSVEPAALPRLVEPSPDSTDSVEALGRDLVERLWSARGRIASTALVCAALAAGLSFVLPPSYVATTQIVDVSPGGVSPVMERMGARLSELGLGSGAPSSAVATYPDLLRSRRLLDAMLARAVHPAKRPQGIALLDLLVKPRGRDDQRMEHGVQKLRKTMDVALDRRSGVLTLRVKAGDPRVAAEIANGSVELLQEALVASRADQAGALRRFIEQRLDETRPDLAKAEEELRVFRENNLRIGNSPRLDLQAGRLQRGLRVQEEVYLTLVQQYEVARIDERRDVPLVSVLDPAIPPAFRSSPRRVVMTVVGLLLGLALGAAWTMSEPRGRSERA